MREVAEAVRAVADKVLVVTAAGETEATPETDSTQQRTGVVAEAEAETRTITTTRVVTADRE